MCCNTTMTMRMGNNLKAIMKVMRLATGRGKSGLNVKELFQMSKPYLNYNLTVDEKFLEENPLETDLNSILPWCQYRDEKKGPKNTQGGKDFSVDSCQLFDPIITDVGICHSFNPTPTMDLLRQSYFTESFKAAFNSDLPIDTKVRMASGSGKQHGLDFYLIGNNVHRKLDNGQSQFYMGISEQNNYFDMKAVSKEIKPGHEIIVRVQATENVPSDELHDIPVAKRNCKFQDENEDLEIFEIYTQSACEYECKIKKAEKICGCYPWYVPAIPKAARHTICDVYGNFCFKETAKNISVECLKYCTPNCYQIEFTSTQEQIPRDPELICNEYKMKNSEFNVGNSLENKIARDMVDKGYYNSLVYKYSKVSEWEKLYKNSDKTKELNIEIDQWERYKQEMELCKILVKDHVAKVSVIFDRNKYVRTVTSLKATFNDKLANFGKKISYFY